MDQLAPYLRSRLTPRLRSAFPFSGVLDGLELTDFSHRQRAPGRAFAAHQPNLLLSDLVLSTIVDAAAATTAPELALYVATDYDALDDARLRTAHIPRFDSLDKTISLSLPWRKHGFGATSLTPILESWDARRALALFVEAVHHQLRGFGKIYDDAGMWTRKRLLLGYVMTMPIGTYREMLNSLVRYFLDFYELPVEFRSGFDGVSASQAQVLDLVSRQQELAAALWDIRARLENAGFVSALAASETSFRVWRIDTASGMRVDAAGERDDVDLTLVPKVLIDDLLDNRLYGHARSRAYIGSAEHYFIAEQIAARLGEAFKPCSFTSAISDVLLPSAEALAERLSGENRRKLLAGRFSHLLLYLFDGDAIKARMKTSIPTNRSVGQ